MRTWSSITPKLSRSALMFSAAFGLSACISLERTELDDITSQGEQKVERLAQQPNYRVTNKPYADKRPISTKAVKHQWLEDIKVGLSYDRKNSDGVPLEAVLDSLNQQGLPIVTTLPPERFSYQGFPIPSGTSAYTVLKILTEQLGVDFQIVDGPEFGDPYVRIIEMGSTTFRLNVPDVESAVQIIAGSGNSGQGGANQGGSGGGLGSNQGGAGGNSGGGLSGNSSGSGLGGNQGGSSGGNGANGGNSGSTSITLLQSQFWTALEEQLEAMMRVQIPVPNQKTILLSDTSNPMLLSQAQARSAQSVSGPLFQEVTVGTVVTNSQTGHVLIRAPKHIRDQIMLYLRDLHDELNTRIQIVGYVLSVTTEAEQSRGIDIAGFKRYSDEEFGVAYTNSILGNVTLDTSDIFSVVADNALAPSILGIRKENGLFSAFNAYLDSVGNTNVVSDIYGNVQSGATYTLDLVSNNPRFTQQSNSVAGEGGTTTTQNTNITNTPTGTIVSITPKYDASSGTITSLINIKLILNKGERDEPEVFTSDGTIEIVNRSLPVTDELSLSTTTPHRVGEEILVGGLSQIEQEDAERGITKAKDTMLGGLFGNARRVEKKTKYFVLLTAYTTSYSTFQ